MRYICVMGTSSAVTKCLAIIALISRHSPAAFENGRRTFAPAANVAMRPTMYPQLSASAAFPKRRLFDVCKWSNVENASVNKAMRDVM